MCYSIPWQHKRRLRKRDPTPSAAAFLVWRSGNFPPEFHHRLTRGSGGGHHRPPSRPRANSSLSAALAAHLCSNATCESDQAILVADCLNHFYAWHSGRERGGNAQTGDLKVGNPGGAGGLLLIERMQKRGCDDASPTSQLRLAHQSPAASLPVFLRPETSGITITCGRTRTASVENDQDLWGIVPTFSCRVDAEREVQCSVMEKK